MSYSAAAAVGAIQSLRWPIERSRAGVSRSGPSRRSACGRSRQLVKAASVLLKLADCFQPSIASTGSTREMLRIVAANQPKTFRYLFKQQRNGAATAPIHGDELQYVFDNLDAPHRGRARPYDVADAKVAAAMADAWVRFAKTGDPNGGDLPPWPRYAGAREPFMAFGPVMKADDGNRTAQLDMIRDYYGRQGRAQR